MSLMFLPHFDVLLKRRTATWNMFVNYILQDCAAHYYRDTLPDVRGTNSFGPNFGETNRNEQGSNVNQTDCGNMILLHLKKAFFLETLVPPYTFSESTVRLSLTLPATRQVQFQIRHRQKLPNFSETLLWIARIRCNSLALIFM